MLESPTQTDQSFVKEYDMNSDTMIEVAASQSSWVAVPPSQWSEDHQKEIDQFQKMYHLLADYSDDTYFCQLTDFDGKVLCANTSWAKKCGFEDGDQMVGRYFADVLTFKEGQRDRHLWENMHREIMQHTQDKDPSAYSGAILAAYHYADGQFACIDLLYKFMVHEESSSILGILWQGAHASCSLNCENDRKKYKMFCLLGSERMTGLLTFQDNKETMPWMGLDELQQAQCLESLLKSYEDEDLTEDELRQEALEEEMTREEDEGMYGGLGTFEGQHPWRDGAPWPADGDWQKIGDALGGIKEATDRRVRKFLRQNNLQKELLMSLFLAPESSFVHDPDPEQVHLARTRSFSYDYCDDENGHDERDEEYYDH